MTGRPRGRTGRGWDAAPPRDGRWSSFQPPPLRPPADGPDKSTEDGRDAEDFGPDGFGPDGSGPDGSGPDGCGSDGTGPDGLGLDGSGPDGSAPGRGSDRGGRGSRGRGGRSGFGGRSAGDTGPVDPAEQARDICLRLLSFRPRTRAELATALRQRGVTDEVAAGVLDRYDEVGIIDDQAFARAWVTSRHHGRGLARRALAGELRRKGVDADAVGAALDELAPDTEVATARELVDRKLRGDRGAPAEALFRRLVGMLARKGYPAGIAIRVVKEALAERDDAAALDGAELESYDPDLLDAEARDAEAESRSD
jgi:regulatory protein